MKKSVPNENQYDLKSVKLPYLAGNALRLFVKLLESPLGSLLIPSLFKSAGISWLRRQKFDDSPTMHPIHFTETVAPPAAHIPQSEWPNKKTVKLSGFQPTTVLDYAAAYRNDTSDPRVVAQRVLEAIEKSEADDPALRAFIAVNPEDVRQQAEASARRIRDGQALSVFDGVPVAVKDEVDMLPYPTTVGTAFLGKSPCVEDSTVVARMRAAGAVLIGKANMHEIGIGVTGLNPIHGTSRNPYDPAHFSGGSSSGSAVAVAAGLCPAAIGADGGGSIRIPASFCGIVGLKPTFGRISEHGAAPLCWSVAHLGPLAATATDTALLYAVLAGPDSHDRISLHQPAPTLSGWDNTDLHGLSIGVFRPWFHHAAADVVSGCEAMLQQLVDMGATLKEISIPNLEAARIAHTITIAGEMAQALDETYAEHHREHGLDVRINLALARRFTTVDYVRAQRIRTRTIANFNRVLHEVDVIITPATGLTAPLIPTKALAGGESNLTQLVEIMRFATFANLTGLPAISFPVGYNDKGLPIGMQAIGRAWQEATLLRLALAAEQNLVRKIPPIHFNLIGS